MNRPTLFLVPRTANTEQELANHLATAGKATLNVESTEPDLTPEEFHVWLDQLIADNPVMGLVVANLRRRLG